MRVQNGVPNSALVGRLNPEFRDYFVTDLERHYPRRTFEGKQIRGSRIQRHDGSPPREQIAEANDVSPREAQSSPAPANQNHNRELHRSASCNARARREGSRRERSLNDNFATTSNHE